MNIYDTVTHIQEYLNLAKEYQLSEAELETGAIELSTLLYQLGRLVQSEKERALAARYHDLLQAPNMSTLIAQMADLLYRTPTAQRSIPLLQEIIHSHDFSKINILDRIRLKAVAHLAHLLPQLSLGMMQSVMRKSIEKLLISDTGNANAHIAEKSNEGLQLTINPAGEEIISDKDAKNFIRICKEYLSSDSVQRISIKLSQLHRYTSGPSGLAKREQLIQELTALYKVAMENPVTENTGYNHHLQLPHKLITLDMEAYADLELSMSVFKDCLDQDELLDYSAGIVVQSYLPDSGVIMKELLEWSQARVARGGAPVYIRLVKGANLNMEKVNAETHGWDSPCFDSKLDSDANFKYLLKYAIGYAQTRDCYLGVGTHNLFDIAYALLLSEKYQVQNAVSIETLYGMSNGIDKVAQILSKDSWVYCPVVASDKLPSTLAYLSRRLDEHSHPDHYLAHSFRCIPGSAVWKAQVDAFRDSFAQIPKLEHKTRRQDNRIENKEWKIGDEFINCPATDFSLAKNIDWAKSIYKKENETQRPLKIQDASTDEILEKSEGAARLWAATDISQRKEQLDAVANTLSTSRSELIASLMTNISKPLVEADAEVCEAIDFCTYYPRSYESLSQEFNLRPKGICLILAPWNFPVGITTGMIAAALTAGNAVIVKASPHAVQASHKTVQCFWNAGISKHLVQFIPSDNDGVITELLGHPKIQLVSLTGSSHTASQLLKTHPELPLITETGGKNAIIVSAVSDMDEAILHVLKSATSFSGQKCSAASLLLLDSERFHDPAFKEALVNAFASLKTGSVWDPRVDITPLNGNAEERIAQIMHDAKASNGDWALIPKIDEENPRLVSPGICWGVHSSDDMAKNEYFAPILSVIEVSCVSEGIDIINASDYGLTAGLESLDPKEHVEFKTRSEAGNLYINRPITGAIVSRQAFGGMKASQIGTSYKAGGNHTLLAYCTASTQSKTEQSVSERSELLEKITPLLKYWEGSGHTVDWNTLKRWAQEYESFHYATLDWVDACHIHGQSNQNAWMLKKKNTLRLLDTDDIQQIAAIVMLAIQYHVPIQLSSDTGKLIPKSIWEQCISNSEYRIESKDAFIERFKDKTYSENVYTLSPSINALKSQISAHHFMATGDPKLDALIFLQEKTLSETLHRYGLIL